MGRSMELSLNGNGGEPGEVDAKPHQLDLLVTIVGLTRGAEVIFVPTSAFGYCTDSYSLLFFVSL
jgi:hypothetical protein